MSSTVTIVMVPRERYSAIFKTLDSLYENTEHAFELIVIDGALPESIYKELLYRSEKSGFEFIHKPYPLSPNEARNIGLEKVNSTYVVFIDNDVVFAKGWLNQLVATADNVNADLIGPTILDGEVEDGVVHACAGESGFFDVEGEKDYKFIPGFASKKLDEIGELQPGITTMLEFHVIMCRTAVFERIGQLDEQIPSFGDHDDLVMSVRNIDGIVYYEPRSVIGYHDPGTNMSVVEKSDMPFYLLRWSDEWNHKAVDRAVKKWGLREGSWWGPHAKHWAEVRRRKSYPRAGFHGRVIAFVMFNVSKKLGLFLERFFYAQSTKKLRAFSHI